jgi:hypothetical protein
VKTGSSGSQKNPETTQTTQISTSFENLHGKSQKSQENLTTRTTEIHQSALCENVDFHTQGLNRLENNIPTETRGVSDGYDELNLIEIVKNKPLSHPSKSLENEI